jgi:hypothetical protein
VDHRLHGRLHHLTEPARPARNPFRNEADAFRVLMMVVAAGALVVAVTLVAGTTPGFVLAVILLGVGGWSSARWARYWLGTREDQD